MSAGSSVSSSSGVMCSTRQMRSSVSRRMFTVPRSMSPYVRSDSRRLRQPPPEPALRACVAPKDGCRPGQKSEISIILSSVGAILGILLPDLVGSKGEKRDDDVEKIRMCEAGRCFESRVCSSPAWQAGLWRQTFWAQTAGEWSGQEKIAYKLQGDRTVRGGLCLLEA